MKVRITKDCDFVVGYLKYGYLETEVEVNSLEEAKEMFPDESKSYYNMDLVVNSYAVNDYEVSSSPMQYEVIKE